MCLENVYIRTNRPKNLPQLFLIYKPATTNKYYIFGWDFEFSLVTHESWAYNKTAKKQETINNLEFERCSQKARRSWSSNSFCTRNLKDIIFASDI